ncbi:ABC transporter ATP-binding protein [Paraclostridium bifermentans]|uniref:ABC transporter ATP-binding protein n=1 Tax=Paraclostridium bifermentans TaxID=1490 RepID=UPI0006B32F8D|nr:ABC transporter ATP-binding protein [Paraclostridium bifermentans]OSB11740.1 glycosyl transferase family 2 [Paraclostridium bifermentans]
MSIVKVKNITKEVSKIKILDNVSLEIEEGEILGLIGPSGSGKSTFIKSIIGMEKITCGEVFILGKKIPNRNVLQSIGYMAQSDALYEDLTGNENLEFFAKIFSINKYEINKRIEYVSNLVNMQNDLNKKVKYYSGGMKRRLSLAISLIQDPKILILDEPTVGIDPKLRLSIWNELNKLKLNGKSIIITTHVMDEAQRCDKLALIRNGKIIANGTPRKLKDEFKVGTIEDIFLKIGGEI